MPLQEKPPNYLPFPAQDSQKVLKTVQRLLTAFTKPFLKEQLRLPETKSQIVKRLKASLSKTRSARRQAAQAALKYHKDFLKLDAEVKSIEDMIDKVK